MSDVQQIVLLILGVVRFMVIVHVVMSLLISFNVLNPYQPLVRTIWEGLEKLFAPIYGPLRQILPDTRPLDLAPLAFLILIEILRILII